MAQAGGDMFTAAQMLTPKIARGGQRGGFSEITLVGGQFGSALDAIPVGEGLMLCSGQITLSAKLTTSAVPANQCAETGNAALNLGCVTIGLVIAA
jgi:hypothetical protein